MKKKHLRSQFITNFIATGILTNEIFETISFFWIFKSLPEYSVEHEFYPRKN